MEIIMKTPVLAMTLLALSASFAAAEVNSLSGKAMSDLPGTKGGATAMPEARIYSNSLADKVQMDRAGRNTGRTINPLVKIEDSSLSSKASRS
jgi:hypothetical protein